MIIRTSKNLQEIKDKAKELKNSSDLEEFKSFVCEDDISDILCNKCSKSCKTSCGFEGLIEVIASGGFDSKFVGDESSLKFSLCEDCLKDLINSFKLKPAIRDDSHETADFIEQETSQNNTKKLSIISKD